MHVCLPGCWALFVLIGMFVCRKPQKPAESVQESNHHRTNNIYDFTEPTNITGNGEYDYAIAVDSPVYEEALPVGLAPSGGHVVTPSGEEYATVCKTRKLTNEQSDETLVENSMYDVG